MMDRLKRAVTLLSLLEELKNRGSWCGETHIQKTTFFLQSLLHVPLGFDFILYKHGPYSFDLNDDLTALLADQLLKVQVRSASYGPSLLPGENSPKLLERFPITRSRYAGHIQFIADRLARKNVAALEKLATALFVTQTHDEQLTVEDRALEINALKPHIAVEEARFAVQQVDVIMEDAKKMIP